MIRNLFGSAGIYFVALVLAPSLLPRQTRETEVQTQLQVQGLKSEYPSCALVDFSVRNTSKRDVYVDVYVERLASGSWNDEAYPYAINDPGSLYSKMVKLNLIKSGESLSLSYNRCLKPKFVKENERGFRSLIEGADSKAQALGAPTSQRIRIEVHDEPGIKVSQKICSQPFFRKSETRSADSSPK
jgi:hypothetical protein